MFHNSRSFYIANNTFAPINIIVKLPPMRANVVIAFPALGGGDETVGLGIITVGEGWGIEVGVVKAEVGLGVGVVGLEIVGEGKRLGVGVGEGDKAMVAEGVASVPSTNPSPLLVTSNFLIRVIGLPFSS